MATGTSDRIMDATLRLVAEQGFAGTTVTAIEEAAGLSPGSGSFYRHFRTKEEALEAAVDREIDRVSRTRSMPEGQADSPQDALRDELRGSLVHMRELRPLIAVLARDSRHVPSLVRKVRSLLVEGGLEVTAARLGDIGVDDPEAAAAVLQAAVVGYHLASDFFGGAPGGVGLDRYADALAAMAAGSSGAARPLRTRRAPGRGAAG